jgi:serine phosphatase RsbU (regulator of sigma subunit)
MLRRFKPIDLTIAALALLALLAHLLGWSGVLPLFLWSGIIVAFFRLVFLVKKRLFYKVRNRLIFSGLFFVVTPIFFLSILFFYITNIIVAQYGNAIIDNILHNQVNELEITADTYLRLQNPLQMQQQISLFLKLNPQFLNVVFSQADGEGVYEPFLVYPAGLPVHDLPAHQLKGFISIGDKLYQGVTKSHGKFRVFVASEVQQPFFDEISGISDFKIRYQHPLEKAPELSVNLSAGPVEIGEDQVFAFPWTYTYSYYCLDSDNTHPERPREGTFYLLIDYDKIFKKLQAGGPLGDRNRTMDAILVVVILFGTFIIISFIIGFRNVRIITRSLNLIIKGTQRIRNGDFSYRIRTKSGDQLQYLADSFNEMARGITLLLDEEKEKQRLEEELRIARTIQLKLLPKETYTCDHFSLAAANIPATEIAGDYFDYFHKENGQLLFLVADVSGKGASAAFYMAELKGLMNYLQRLNDSPREILHQCHTSLSDSFERVTFITVNMALVDPATDRLVLARAGHTPAIYYQAAQNRCTILSPAGMAIGLSNFSREKIEETVLTLGEGDILFFFSDGLSEIQNDQGDMLGVDALSKLICRHAHLSCEQIKERVLEASNDYSGEEQNCDDLTFVLFKYHKAAHTP